MLDTDICSYIMKRTSEPLLRRIRKIPVSEVSISVITKAELLYGIEISPRRHQDQKALDAFLAYAEVLDFRDEAATHYARIHSELKGRGTMIGANDLLIAAHARCLDLTLVTNNTREFSRVYGLKIQNWTLA